MVWYFISVYAINRTLCGSLEIRNFSSRIEKNISLVHSAYLRNIFLTFEGKFSITERPCKYPLRSSHYQLLVLNILIALSMFSYVLTSGLTTA